MTVFTTDPYAIVQTAGETYIGDGTDQVYSINPAMIQAGEVVTIIDQGGTNAIELNAGLEITESIVSNNELVLTLSNGAIVNVRGADTFTFNVGQNQAGGDNEGTELEFADFAQDILGVTLPAEGEAPVEGGASTVNDDGTADVTPVGTPSLSIDDVSVTEGDADTTTATFTVTLSEAPGAGETVTVDYATEDGTATAGDDYVAATGSLTFAEGETTQTIEVTVNGDTEFEADETFNVVLDESSIVGTIGGEAVVISDGTGAGTITNDDEEAVAGETITLTTGDDVVGPDGAEGFATTEGDDTIVGSHSGLTSTRTFDTTDQIDGGDGTDTLDLEMSSNFTGFSGDGKMENVEILDIENTSTLARTYDATGTTGLETVIVDTNDQDFTIQDLASTGLSMEISNADEAKTVTAEYATGAAIATDDTLAVTLNDVGSAEVKNAAGTVTTAQKDLSVASSNIEELSVTAAGTANFVDLSGVNAAKSITADGAGDLEVTAVAATVTSFDGSEATGAVEADLTGGGTFTTVKTGTGDDKVTVDTLSVAAAVSGGTGDDELVLGDFTAGDKTLQMEMDGFETLTFLGQTNNVTFAGTNVLDVETIKFSDGIDGAKDVTFTGMTPSSMDIVLAETATGIYGTTAGTVKYTDAADLTVSVDSGKTSGTADIIDNVTANQSTSVILNVSAYANYGGALTAAKAQNVTITVDEDAELGGANGTAAAVAAADATSITIDNSGDLGGIGFVLTAEDLESLTVRGSEAVDLTDPIGGGSPDLGSKASSINVDASDATGAFTASFNDYTTGAGSLTVVGANLAANTITVVGGRNEIDITGGIIDDAVFLNEAITGTAALSFDLGAVSALDYIQLDGGAHDWSTATVTFAGVNEVGADNDTADTLKAKAALFSGTEIDLDGTSTTDFLGSLTLVGTTAADTIDLSNLTVTTGNTQIIVEGSGGEDTITASTGDDIFNYTAASQSSGSNVDTIKEFEGASGSAGSDLIAFDADASGLFASAIASSAVHYVTGNGIAASNLKSLSSQSWASVGISASAVVQGFFAGPTASSAVNGSSGYADKSAFISALNAVSNASIASQDYVAFALNTAGTLLWVANAVAASSALSSAAVVMTLAVDANTVVAGDIVLY